MNENVVMYYNPACSKCAYALEYLKQHNITPTLIHYLETNPTFTELKELVKTLGLHPKEIVRTTEQLFIDSYAHQDFSDDEWLHLLVKHPDLLQRPLLIKGNYGIVGRNTDNLNRLLDL